MPKQYSVFLFGYSHAGMGKYSLWVVILLHVVFDRGQWALTRHLGSCVEAETGFPQTSTSETFTFPENVKYVTENVTCVTADTRHGTGPKTPSSAAKSSDDHFALSDVTPLKQTTSEEEQSLTATRVRFSETLYGDDRVDIAVTISKSSPRRSLQSKPDAILIWSRYLFLILDPVVTTVGTAGNLVMLVALRRQSLRHNPVSAFMTGLAVADTLVLLLDFLNNWVYMVVSINKQASKQTNKQTNKQTKARQLRIYGGE